MSDLIATLKEATDITVVHHVYYMYIITKPPFFEGSIVASLAIYIGLHLMLDSEASNDPHSPSH